MTLLAAQSNALLFVVVAAFCCCISHCQAVCMWNYNRIPPLIVNENLPELFFHPCNPFVNGSMFSVNFVVSGPSEVEFNCYSESTHETLVNSTKYSLVTHLVEDQISGGVTVSLRLIFSNLEVSVNSGIYYCNAKVKETGNFLSPIVRFNINMPSVSLYNDVQCNGSLPFFTKQIPGGCPEEEIDHPVQHSLPSTASSSSVSATGAMHLPNPSTSVSVEKTSLFSTTVSVEKTSLSSVHISNSASSYQQQSSTYSYHILSPPSQTVTSMPYYNNGSIASTSSITTDNTLSNNTVATTPPVDTWFYLLSVVVVLAFLSIALSLVLAIFCIKKQNNDGRGGSRTTVIPSPSTPEEIRVQRIGRLPSDPLPKIIREIDNKGTHTGTTEITSQSLIHSGPLNSNTSSHALSLQHLAFNLGSSFQSNSTLYAEIDAPPFLEVDIVRDSHEYVNGNRYTLQSDATSQSYAVPPNTQGSEDLSCCIEATPERFLSDRRNEDYIDGSISGSSITGGADGSSEVAMTTTLESYTTTTGSSDWYSNNPLAIVSQTHWENGDINTLDNEQLLRVSLSQSQSPHSVFSETDQQVPTTRDGDELSDDTEDDCSSQTSGTGPLLIQQRSSSKTANTLSKQTFDLTTPTFCTRQVLTDVSEQVGVAIDSGFVHMGASSTMKSVNTMFPDVERNLAKDDSFIPSQLGGSTADSRSSSSTSGCTDISKYSGDYDRDPAYMRMLLSRMRPHLPGCTSLDTSNEDLRGQEVRADSGMESLYTAPIVSPHPISMRTDTSDLYKSLNSLTMEAEPLYDSPLLKPWVDPRPHPYLNSI